MIGMRLLDVALGVILMFLLVSLLVTTVQEAIASLFKTRAANLYRSIRGLLHDDVLVQKLYRHPLLLGPYSARGDKGGAHRPSYVANANFVLALLDVVNDESAKPTALVENAATIVGNLKGKNDKLYRVLSVLVKDAEQFADQTEERVAAIRERLEQWFDDAMTRGAGWYKRQTQWMCIGIGLVAAVAINADAIYVANALWKDAGLRTAVAAAAAAYEPREGAAAAGEEADTRISDQLVQQLESITVSRIPVGFENESPYLPQLRDEDYPPVLVVFGWLITGLATSLGAAFWFDVLQRALNIRSSLGSTSAGRQRAKRDKNPRLILTAEGIPASRAPRE